MMKWNGMSKASIVLAMVMVLFITAVPQSAQAATVTGSINWGSSTGKYAGDYAYGLNIFKAQETGAASNTDYKNNMAYMKPGIIRYHRSDMMSDSGTTYGWVVNPTTSGYAWDAAKIDGILTETFSHNPVRMINIANWPAYMDDGTGKLKTNMYDAYAAFVANLVQIVNINQGHNVQYWEVLNEKDDVYANNMAELATIYKKAYDAMRARSSTIKIGGPAFARPDLTARVETFIANAHAKLDFVSFHSYNSGCTCDTNAAIWNSAQGLGSHTTDFKNILSQYTTRSIEIFHDEFNISWNPPDGRMNNEIGMVFDALAVMSMAKAGASGSMAWNESDGWYGKLEGWAPYNKRASAHLYSIMNSDMKGDIVTNTVSDASKVDLMAVKTGSWKKIMLVNRSGADQTVQLSFTGWSTSIPGNTLITVKRVYGWGIVYEDVRYDTLTGSNGFTLGSNSVAVLVLDENNKRYASNNVLTNGDFNANTGQTPTNWSTWTQNGLPESDYSESGGRTGNRLTHYNANDWASVYTYQTVTGLANGTYTLSAWVQRGPNIQEAALEVKGFGGTEIKQAFNQTSTWTEVKISNIQVTNNQAEVGIWSKGPAGTYVYIDDVSLTKN